MLERPDVEPLVAQPVTNELDFDERRRTICLKEAPCCGQGATSGVRWPALGTRVGGGDVCRSRLTSGWHMTETNSEMTVLSPRRSPARCPS